MWSPAAALGAEDRIDERSALNKISITPGGSGNTSEGSMRADGRTQELGPKEKGCVPNATVGLTQRLLP